MARKGEPGFVYILSNPCFPYLKIGQTKNSPRERCDQLSRMQAAPKPFKLEYSAAVDSCYEGEQLIHAAFKEYRIGKKEFFEVDLELAIATLHAKIKHAEESYAMFKRLVDEAQKRG